MRRFSPLDFVPHLLPFAFANGEPMLAMAIGAELLFARNGPGVGLVLLDGDKDLLGVVASHTSRRDLALRIHNLGRRAIPA